MEVRAKGEEDKDAGCKTLIHNKIEKLQSRGVDPVKVFHNKQYWLLLRIL
jgi:hypothetical protein